MRKVPCLTWRELSTYFHTPTAYVALTVLTAFAGFTFYRELRFQPIASVNQWMQGLYGIAILVVPLVTMRLLAEEFSRGSIEMLLTAPVTGLEVVVSKYLGAMGLFLFLMAPTLAFPAVIAWLGEPDAGPVFTGYLGLVLTGSLLVSVGLFFSSLTRSQVVAAVLTLLAFVALCALGYLTWLVGEGAGAVFKRMGMVGHMEDFFVGVVDLRDVGYFVMGSAFFLFLSVKVLELRRS